MFLSVFSCVPPFQKGIGVEPLRAFCNQSVWLLVCVYPVSFYNLPQCIEVHMTTKLNKSDRAGKKYESEWDLYHSGVEY